MIVIIGSENKIMFNQKKIMRKIVLTVEVELIIIKKKKEKRTH